MFSKEAHERKREKHREACKRYRERNSEKLQEKARLWMRKHCALQKQNKKLLSPPSLSAELQPPHKPSIATLKHPLPTVHYPPGRKRATFPLHEVVPGMRGLHRNSSSS
ncbi:hypothetical protein H0H92_015439 [Tricholoma furcatifolium]|nr:hypothetical protein H0H92_015439 [Tricholoma furcatifolium]